MPIADLAQAIVKLVAVRRNTERTAEQLHRIARAPEREDTNGIFAGAWEIVGEDISEQFTGANRLPFADVVQRDVLRTLETASGIPFGLTVADEINGGHARGDLLFRQRDIRRIGTLHARDVIAGIDVVHFAGHAA